MKPLSEMKSLYKEIPSGSRIITYCHPGARVEEVYRSFKREMAQAWPQNSSGTPNP